MTTSGHDKISCQVRNTSGARFSDRARVDKKTRIKNRLTSFFFNFFFQRVNLLSTPFFRVEAIHKANI